jgi:hypothetical protein
MRGEGPGSLRLRDLLLPPVLPMATTSAGVEPSGRRDTRKAARELACRRTTTSLSGR